MLAWLNGRIEKWKPFVRNRIATIRENLEKESWNYVPTSDNPADIISRGCDFKTFSKLNFWFHGPKWLHEKDTYEQTLQPLNYNEETCVKKEEKKELLCTTVHIIEDNWLTTLGQKYSNFSLSCRILAWVTRFIKNCKTKKYRQRTNFILLKEIKIAEEHFLRAIQSLHFENDREKLLRKGRVARQSIMRQLNPFIDSTGLIRVGGRIQKSTLCFNQKHPVILPSNSGMIRLIIEECHRSHLHGGFQVTMNQLRRKYWIIRAGQTVKSVIRRCVICCRARPSIARQLMGNLPQERLDFTKAFLHTGVDFAGPFHVRAAAGRGVRISKCYIAVFICLAVKAIHLELVGALTSEAFLAALSRFRSRRGRVDRLFSDNGTNFIGAFKRLNDIDGQLSRKGIEWEFIPPLAPNFGGLWEAGVKSLKTHLKTQCGSHSFTFEEFQTLLCEIETCLNARPLCPITNDIDSLDSLTPQHFLTFDVLEGDLDGRDFLHTEKRYLSRWEYLKKLRQEIIYRYKLEYVTRLNNRPKNLKKKNISTRQLVLVR